MHKFNESYFDKIDTKDKAYWIGFIWCDGYVSRRERPNKTSVEYTLKISLNEDDSSHLSKFARCLEWEQPIKFYSYSKSAFKTDKLEARLSITRKSFCARLYEDFGIVPYRNDIGKLAKEIPEHLIKFFILGAFDANGSFSFYTVAGKKEVLYKKAILSMNTHPSLIEFIQEYFMCVGLIQSKQKYYKRHIGRDGHNFDYKISGTVQVINILNHLYSDATDICLTRKHEKFLNRFT